MTLSKIPQNPGLNIPWRISEIYQKVCNPTHISTSTVQIRLLESGLQGRISTKKPLWNDTDNKKRLPSAKKHKQWTLDWWKSVFSVWWVQIWGCWFQLLCLCEMQCRSTDDLRISGSHREAWRRWCGGTLLVALSVIYLQFKGNLTSMATTVFCIDMPSHLVCT
jgi:hypothetical protein